MSAWLSNEGTLEKLELLFPNSSRVFPMRSIGRPSTFLSSRATKLPWSTSPKQEAYSISSIDVNWIRSVPRKPMRPAFLVQSSWVFAWIQSLRGLSYIPHRSWHQSHHSDYLFYEPWFKTHLVCIVYILENKCVGRQLYPLPRLSLSASRANLNKSIKSVTFIKFHWQKCDLYTRPIKLFLGRSPISAEL